MPSIYHKDDIYISMKCKSSACDRITKSCDWALGEICPFTDEITKIKQKKAYFGYFGFRTHDLLINGGIVTELMMICNGFNDDFEQICP